MPKNKAFDADDFDGSTLFESWFKEKSAWWDAISDAFENDTSTTKRLFGNARLGEDEGDNVTLNIRGTAKLLKQGKLKFADDPETVDGKEVDEQANVLVGKGQADFLGRDAQWQADNQFPEKTKDTVQNTGSNAPIIVTGGGKNDVLFGSDKDDIMAGNKGNDEIYANGGNDFVKGGAGKDIIHGGLGDDQLNGDYSDSNRHDKAQNKKGKHWDDKIWGHEGDDVLFGNQGDDYVNGGSDNDIVIGGLGDDFLNGGTGNDRLTGGLVDGIGDVNDNEVVPDLNHFDLSAGNDVITDFDINAGSETSFDKLVFTAEFIAVIEASVGDSDPSDGVIFGSYEAGDRLSTRDDFIEFFDAIESDGNLGTDVIIGDYNGDGKENDVVLVFSREGNAEDGVITNSLTLLNVVGEGVDLDPTLVDLSVYTDELTGETFAGPNAYAGSFTSLIGDEDSFGF